MAQLQSTDEPIVSIWFGTFPNADAHHEYFSVRAAPGADDETCRWWKDLGVEGTDPDQEDGSGYVGEPVPVEELIEGVLSYLDSFREPLMAACRSAGMMRANLVLALYGYDLGTGAGFHSPFMKFVGAFRYQADD